MDNPAFLIDGYMEKSILQKMKIDAPIRRIDLNGKNVKISAIAIKISPVIRTFEGKYQPIVIVIDREGRKESPDDISRELLKELAKIGIKDKIIIGVADRMTENWILADWDNFCKKSGYSKPKPRFSFEGTNGKAKIKKMIKGYQETSDGVELFLNSRSSIIKDTSPSFNSFYQQIRDVKSRCKWLKS